MESNVKSVLKLEKLVFDEITFKRVGFTSSKEIEFQINSRISQSNDSEAYRVSLALTGNKPEEYTINISLSGFFTLSSNSTMNAETKRELISRNTVAILMPYLRSEVSLLTAQPGVDCVVLPPFNINNMLEKE